MNPYASAWEAASDTERNTAAYVVRGFGLQGQWRGGPRKLEAWGLNAARLLTEPQREEAWQYVAQIEGDGVGPGEARGEKSWRISGCMAYLLAEVEERAAQRRAA